MNTLYVILLTEVGIYKGKSNIQEKIKKTHDLDQGKKVTKISTKKTSNFKILLFSFINSHLWATEVTSSPIEASKCNFPFEEILTHQPTRYYRTNMTAHRKVTLPTIHMK